MILISVIAALEQQRKSLPLVLVKKTPFCLSLPYNGDNGSLFVTEKESYKFKAPNKLPIFQFSFGYVSYLKNLVLLNLEKYLLKKMYSIFQSITMLLINLTN